MLPNGILESSRVLIDADVPSKKRVLEVAANLLGEAAETSEAIFARLLERERLGSTGLAGGVALPHARMPGAVASHGVFIRLKEPIEFDSLDGQPVDLVFALLVPEDATDEHLKLLAQLARLFNETAFRDKLRAAEDVETAVKLFNGGSADHAA